MQSALVILVPAISFVLQLFLQSSFCNLPAALFLRSSSRNPLAAIQVLQSSICMLSLRLFLRSSLGNYVPAFLLLQSSSSNVDCFLQLFPCNPFPAVFLQHPAIVSLQSCIPRLAILFLQLSNVSLFLQSALCNLVPAILQYVFLQSAVCPLPAALLLWSSCCNPLSATLFLQIFSFSFPLRSDHPGQICLGWDGWVHTGGLGHRRCPLRQTWLLGPGTRGVLGGAP